MSMDSHVLPPTTLSEALVLDPIVHKSILGVKHFRTLQTKHNPKLQCPEGESNALKALSDLRDEIYCIMEGLMTILAMTWHNESIANEPDCIQLESKINFDLVLEQNNLPTTIESEVLAALVSFLLAGVKGLLCHPHSKGFSTLKMISTVDLVKKLRAGKQLPD